MIKNKTHTLLLFILCFIFDITISFSQALEIDWQNTIGGTQYDYCRSVEQADDGGFIIGGHSTSTSSGDKTENTHGGSVYGDYWVLKLTSTGTISWQNTIGGSGEDLLKVAKQTADGGYILGGYSKSGISADKTEANIGDYDYWVIKLNSTGGIVWQNTIGGTGEDQLNSIALTSDGGYLLGGYSLSGISGDKTEGNIGSKDYWVIKLNATGGIVWQNTIGGTDEDWLFSVVEIPTGGFLLGGFSSSGISGDKTESNLGSRDYWVIKIDDLGNIVWQNTIGGPGEDELKSIDNASDNGFILGGSSYSTIGGDKIENSQGLDDYWIIKIDSDGNIIWQNDIGGNSSDILTCIKYISPEGYLLGGYSSSDVSEDKSENNYGSTSDYWVVQVDGSGQVQFENTIGGTNTDILISVDQTIDGNYILGGCSSSTISGDKTEELIGLGFTDYWIMKLTSCFEEWYLDSDSDGFGDPLIHLTSCDSVIDFVNNDLDCDDSEPMINPDIEESLNGIDDNCNGYIDDIEPAISWQNTIGGNSYDLFSIINKTSDGGYILGGFSQSNISGDKTENILGHEDYWIIKLNAAGNLEWQNTIGGSNSDYLSDISQTADGGYIAIGSSWSGISADKTEALVDASNSDIWVLKLDNVGNIQWQNDIGGSLIDQGACIKQTDDGGFIVGGSSFSSISGDKSENEIGIGPPHNDYWVIKLNSAGDIVWQNTIGGNRDDLLSYIEQTSDGGFIIAGTSNSQNSGDKLENVKGGSLASDCWVVKLNSSGSIEWENTIGGSRDDWGFVIHQVEDGYILGASSDSPSDFDKTEGNIGNTNKTDYWVLKLNSLGGIIWQNTIGGIDYDMLSDLKKCDDGGYIVSGVSISPESGDKTEGLIGESTYDIWLLKLDSLGQLKWQSTIGGTDEEQDPKVLTMDDGGYLLGCTSKSGDVDKTEPSIGSEDLWIIKIDHDCSMELCNSLDDNCNGLIDDGVVETISISAGGPTTFCQGGSVVLSAVNSGATVQWQKNGANIPGAIFSTYTATKKGNYTCVTTSSCDTVTSSGIFVNVLKNPAASISAGGATTFCAGGSVTLSEVPSGGCTYQWYKGASAIAGATTTNYIATTTGNYKCRVTKTATGCYKNSNAIAVSVPCRESNTPVGEEGGLFTIYPNPANEILFISIDQLTSQDSPLLTHHSSLIITDVQGKEIFRSEINSLTSEINISDFASGMYFVKVKINGQEMIEKFIKN